MYAVLAGGALLVPHILAITVMAAIANEVISWCSGFIIGVELIYINDVPRRSGDSEVHDYFF